ncbi:hypothetical protein M408DRAFT_10884 [Serendipita vermifera MAFF 305830]|uniref:Uncharacterized protein n=1 Tax=Serendipita vermifera MAFF 305830 TaxID=933852 RepID=A0A0C3AZE3_SERVB|nr:hypothetical protein M408DRAFT_10884 [Serendipita vermifera MAFF 305830]
MSGPARSPKKKGYDKPYQRGIIMPPLYFHRITKERVADISGQADLVDGYEHVQMAGQQIWVRVEEWEAARSYYYPDTIPQVQREDDRDSLFSTASTPPQITQSLPQASLSYPLKGPLFPIKKEFKKTPIVLGCRRSPRKIGTKQPGKSGLGESTSGLSGMMARMGLYVDEEAYERGRQERTRQWAQRDGVPPSDEKPRQSQSFMLLDTDENHRFKNPGAQTFKDSATPINYVLF